MARADSMVKSLQCKNNIDFWKEARKSKNNYVPFANKENIANMWKSHFSKLLNSVKDTSKRKYVIDSSCDTEFKFINFKRLYVI